MQTQIIPYLFYDDIAAAIAFLTPAFGFKEALRVVTPSGGVHAEISLGGQTVMLAQGADNAKYGSPRALGRATAGVFIYLEAVEAHYAQARAAGAEIITPIEEVSYGRTYAARDPQGQIWYFTTPPEG